MDMVYLQVDSRYNKWLFQEIRGISVLEYTLNNIEKLNCEKIVAGIYNCCENQTLIETLSKKGGGVELVLSDDENVNSRFVDCVIEEPAEYIIRVGGDQIFLDTERTIKILEQMHVQKADFFYHPGMTSVWPDIVRTDCIRKHRNLIMQEDRYFNALKKEGTINRYTISLPCTLLYDFRVNSNEQYRICKNVLEKNLDIYDLSLNLSSELKNTKNYLNRTGIWGSWILGNSYEDFFWDENRKVNPWWGKSIIDLIIPKLNKNMRVFEWGMGNSTLFWSQYVAEVVSVESDVEWYQKMRGIIPNNISPKYCKLEYNGEYCRSILDTKGEFDIILIDGRDRVRCAHNSLGKLKENGIIIWDNTDRAYYQEGYDFIKSHGFKQLELSSIIYGSPTTEDYTSIFYRKNNILQL